MFTTMSICVSMWWLEYENTPFFLTIPTKYTTSLKNNLSHIIIILPITGINRHKTPLATTYRWHWQMLPVSNPPWHIRPKSLPPPMFIKYQDGKLYPDLYMHNPLILEAWLVISSLIHPPWNSSKDNTLITFIVEYSDFNKKSTSMECFSLLK